MVIYAIGSVAAWGALSAAEQAYYTGGRVDDINAVVADHGDPMSDDVTMETLDEEIIFVGIQTFFRDCGAFRWIFQAKTYHYGDPTQGNWISINHNTTGIFAWCAFNQNMTGTIRNIKIRGVYTLATVAGSALINLGGGTLNSNTELLVENCLCDGGNVAANRHKVGIGLNGTSSGGTYNVVVKNTKVYRHLSYGFDIVGFGSDKKGPILENVSIDNNGEGVVNPFGIRNNQFPANVPPVTLRNVVSFNAGLGIGTDYVIVPATEPILDPGVNVIENIADSDASAPAGTGVLNNIVPANEFQSTDPTNANYLRLKLGSVTADWTREPAGNVNVGDKIKFDPEVTLTPGAASLGDGGTVPTLITEDIAGEAIPSKNGEYPIGCHVQEYST